MAQKPNRLLRVVVPLVLILVGIGAAASVFINSTNAPKQPEPVDQTEQQIADQAADLTEQSQPEAIADPEAADDEQTQPEADVAAEESPSEEQDQTAGPIEPEAQPAAPGSSVSLAGLRARQHDATEAFDPIGSIDADGAARMQIEFSKVGAGIASLKLASEFDSVESYTKYHVEGEAVGPEHHVELQSEQKSGSMAVTPFAALWVEIENAPINIFGTNVWLQTAPGEFEAFIENDAGEAVVRITRNYVLTDGTHDLRIEQKLTNMSGSELNAQFVQFGPIDMPEDAVTYGGDKRRVRFGYMMPPSIDINREYVSGKKFLTPRTSVLGPKSQTQTWQNPESGKVFQPYIAAREVWPNEKSIKSNLELVWAAMSNRYYGVAVHSVESPGSPLAFDSIKHIDRVVLQETNQPKDGVLILRLTGKVRTLAAGESSDESIMVYAGPTSKAVIDSSPAAVAAGIKELVVYNFGGPCAMCTFTWLSDPLLGMVRFLQSFVGDWSIAIILLVFCVRGVLHPINRWSQIRMQRFAKQMQDLGPKQKKIQEKYAGDKAKIQQEMAKLWREEGVNPAGMLGCLPMLLQSPIWIALYASLYFLYELRQQPAFYGLFQTLSGGAWPFMADLSEPDHFIPLGAGLHFTVPLMGVISAINIMPLMLGVVFFMHQKFLTPATTTTLTPEQQKQQKMIKVMTVVMFPIIMYNAPCGLALYFIANSTIAIAENSWIRAHINKHNLLEVTKKPKGPKGGFMAKLQEISNKQQAIREQQQRMRDGGKGSPKNSGGETTAQRAMRKGRE
jgi:YidC/Oxa1 family membrane protein insertase